MRTINTRLFAPILFFLLLAPAGNAVDAAGESGDADADAGQMDEQSGAPPSDSVTAREAAHRQFLRFRDDERYADALNAARTVVELTSEEFGSDSEMMIAPLTNLATSQVELDDLKAAEENYRAAIRLIEKFDGYLSPRLVNPLIGLGSVFNRSRRYNQAVATFDRALRVNHVERGFTNVEQFAIRDGLTESYIGLKDNEEANFHQETQLEINRRRFGTQSIETGGAYKKLGDWYARSGQVEPALESYRRADRIYSGEGTSALHRRVESLESLALLYQRLGQLGTSSSALRKALEIIDAAAETDYSLRARVLVDLGDVYSIFGKLESADRRYRQAWSDLSQGDQFLDERDEYFDLPVRVAGRRLATLNSTDDARDAPRQRLRDGYVLLGYTVAPTGRVKDVKVIESDPAGVMDERLVSLWSRSKFRPRYVDGQPVTAENLLLRHDFQYAVEPAKPADDSKSRRKGQLEYPAKKSDDPPDAPDN